MDFLDETFLNATFLAFSVLLEFFHLAIHNGKEIK